MRGVERKHHNRIDCFGQVMRLKKNFVNSVSEKFSLPAEALSAVPYIQLHGSGKVCIENHGGVLAYSEEQVRVAVKGGAVVIQGQRLSICAMSRRCLEIRGIIQELKFDESNR